MVEIGRIEIVTKVSMMSSHNAYPREGHFEMFLHMMCYLKVRHNSRIAMNPNYSTLNEDRFFFPTRTDAMVSSITPVLYDASSLVCRTPPGSLLKKSDSLAQFSM